MSFWIKLTKSSVPVWINAELLVRIDEHKAGAHLDFQDADLEEVVDQTPEEVMGMIGWLTPDANL